VVTAMQSAISVGFFRPEFDDFLYAQVIAEPEEETLSVISALSRLNIDPWLEASELSGLSDENGIQRLARLLARLPGRRWTQEYCRVVATRLIKLLPRPANAGLVLPANVSGLHDLLPKGVSPLYIFVAFALILVVFALGQR